MLNKKRRNNVGATAKLAAAAIASAIAMSGCGLLSSGEESIAPNDDTTAPVISDDSQSEDMEQSHPADKAQSESKKKSATSVKKDEKRDNARSNTTRTTLTPAEAHALDAQGRYGGVVSRTQAADGTTVTVTREGNELVVTTTPANTSGGRTQADPIRASEQKPAQPNTGATVAKPAEKPAQPDTTIIPDGAATGTPAGHTNSGGTITPSIDNTDHSGGAEQPTQPDNAGSGNVASGGNKQPSTPSQPTVTTPSGSGATTPVTPSTDNKSAAQKQYDTESTKYLDTIRAKLIDRVNEARTDAGINPLKVSVEQSASAQTWANMVQEKNLYGVHVADWANEHNNSNYPEGVIGHRSEVMPYYHGEPGTDNRLGKHENSADNAAEGLFLSLWNEEGHRRAIMDAKATHVGIGIVMGESNTDNRTTVQVVMQQTTEGILTKKGKSTETTTLSNPDQQRFVDDPSGKYEARPTTIAPAKGSLSASNNADTTPEQPPATGGAGDTGSTEPPAGGEQPEDPSPAQPSGESSSDPSEGAVDNNSEPAENAPAESETGSSSPESTEPAAANTVETPGVSLTDSVPA